MIGILLALISAVSLSLSQVILKRSFDHVRPSVAFFLDAIFGIVVWVPFSIILGVDFQLLSELFFYAFLSAVLSEAYFFYIISKGQISITGILLASYPVYTILFSLLINQERLTPHQWLSVGIVIFGTLIITWPGKLKKSDLVKVANILWALSGAIAVGLADTLAKNIIDRTSSASFLFALAVIQTPIAIIFLRIDRQRIPRVSEFRAKINIYKYAVTGSLLNVIGVAFLFSAFEKTLASIASPIIGSYPVLIVLFARILLRETLQKADIVGILIVAIGIWQLSLTV